ncbi:hypothetical protein ACX40Y_14180 [Sphingomonas sp. RS6]
MTEPEESYFSVTAHNETAAVAYVTERGFPPIRVEQDGVQRVLVFPPLPDEEMARLAQALPIHLSVKIGIVGGYPFT